MFFHNPCRPFQRLRYPKKILSVVIAATLAPTFVWAADENSDMPSDDVDAPELMEEVSVTGFRRSLDKAISIKKESTGVVDVIVAEDIAKFPDTNLAESLQRVPGVSITRERGEGRQISVRGLGADFTRVRINGMEAQAATEGNSTRGFDFNVFASELFNSITVRKTSSANVDEGSLGATVDLQTGRPFDYDDFTVGTSVQGGFNGQSEEFTPRAAFLISNTFADGKLGALFSAAYSERTVDQVGDSSGVYYGGDFAGGFCDPADIAGRCYGEAQPAGYTVAEINNPDVYVPRFPRSVYQSTEQERLGLTAAFQFSPSDQTLLNLDVLYSDLDVSRREKYVQGVFYSDQPGIVVRDVAFQGSNMVAGTMDNVDLRTENMLDESNTKYTQVTFSGDHQFSDRFSLSGLAGYAKSDFSNPIETTVQMDSYDSQGFTFDATGGAGELDVAYGTDVNDPDTWYVGPPITLEDGSTVAPEIRLNPSWTEYTEETLQFDTEFIATDSISVLVGVQYKRFNFNSFARRTLSTQIQPELPEGVSIADISESYTGPDGVTWLLPSISGFDEVFGIYSNTGDFTMYAEESGSARGLIREVEEEDTGAYLQVNFFKEIAGMELRGDVGIRYVKTDQWSDGFVQSGDNYQRVAESRTYDNWLPALNLVLAPSDELLFRFSTAKVMTRPTLGSVSPNTSISTGDGVAYVSSGNPDLDPIQATTYDLSVEWYPVAETMVALGLFYKDIDTYTQTLTQTGLSFADTGLDPSALEGTGASTDDVFQVSQPVNTEGGPLKGVEVGLQQPLGVMADWLDGFGILLNYTYVDSEIDYLVGGDPDNTVTGPLLGLSKNAYNATLYYEKYNWSVRVSGAYRSRYTRGIPGPSNQDIWGTDETFNVDASIAYDFDDHLSVSLEGINLTDEATSWYSDSSQRWQDYYQTGPEILLGLRYRY